MEIILASASPRRKELLEKIVRGFKVIPSHVDENFVINQENPSKIAETLAFKKAGEIAGKYPASLVIGADTIVEKSGVIYGKPAGEKEAVKMLKELRGTTQNVITGLAVLCKSLGVSVMGSELSTVKMREDITDEEIENYVKSGEGEDKAGSYAVQEKGDRFIEWIKGDYYNVVGFPLCRLYEMLKEAEIRGRFKIGFKSININKFKTKRP